MLSNNITDNKQHWNNVLANNITDNIQHWNNMLAKDITDNRQYWNNVLDLGTDFLVGNMDVIVAAETGRLEVQ